jgi:hypothetical protein
LDVNETLKLFQDEFGGTRPEPPSPAVPTEATASPATSTASNRFEGSLKRPDDAALPVANNNRFYTIAFAVILLTLIAFVAKMMDKYQKESRDANTPVAEVAAVTETSTTVPMSLPQESPPTTIPAAPAEIISTTTTTLQKSTLTVLPTTTTTAPPSTAASANVAPATTVTQAKPAAEAPVIATTTTTTTTTTPAKQEVVEVIVETTSPVTIRFSLTEGQKWETIEMAKDQVHTFRGKTSVVLEVTDAGAMNVIVNGRERGVPGAAGKPMRLKFP